MRKLLLTFFSLILLTSTTNAAVNILKCSGWFEAGYATWEAVSGATNYNVYIAESGSTAWKQLDKELVRQYPNYFRADAVGLKAGDYQLKVVPVNASGEMASEAATASFTAAAHDRSGFAHVGMTGGIGAYKNDGTLKDNAKVIYVWADNAKTVTCDVITSTKGTTTKGVGLQNIIDLYQKGLDTTPLCVRLIGTIKKENMDELSSSAEGLQVKGRNGYSEMPITIEGIGEDAAIYGFGILVRNCKGTEFRNFAILLCMDDCLSLDTQNSNIWIHNIDFFYGNAGGDSDQAKGDGTVDIKAKSKNCTVSYNHFFDSGKCSLGGMGTEETTAWHTYHHNWFDHSDSRHPRIRVQFFHVYNNYFDGVSKYGVGCTSGGSAFVEANYFRNTKYPYLISKQGTDAEGDGTFSGETGGVIKAFNNITLRPRKIQYSDDTMTNGKWDAILVSDRNATVTSTALDGDSAYNATADQAARTTYIENKMDAPEDVPAIVRGSLGAGRMNHGDIKWTFRNSAQDENYDVVAALKTMEQNYKSTLVGFADGTTISNGGATTTVDDGDGKGIPQETNDAAVPSWGNGSIYINGVLQGSDPSDNPGGGTTADPTQVIGTNGNYFWFNTENESATNAYISSGVITLDSGSGFKPTVTVTTSDGTSYSDKVGSLQLAKSNGYVVFYNEKGIEKIDFFLARTGSMSGKVLGSKDGVNFTEIQSYSGSKGTKDLSVSTIYSIDGYKYIKLTNAATGSLHVQGVRLFEPAEATAINSKPSIVNSQPSKIYNLRGQRLSKINHSGIYIINGKKAIVR